MIYESEYPIYLRKTRSTVIVSNDMFCCQLINDTEKACSNVLQIKDVI